MRPERLRRVLKTLLVYPEMAGGAAVHFLDFGKMIIIIKVFQHHLLDTQRGGDKVNHGRVEDILDQTGFNACQFFLNARFFR